MVSRFRVFTFAVLVILGSLLSTSLIQANSPPFEIMSTILQVPIVESEHPYQNNEDIFWIIPNDSGQSAARIHFSRIELEDGVDKIEIRDTNDTLIQEITTSSPDGLWTDIVPGASIKIVLKTDGSGRFWGFAIDQIETLDYTTLLYSPHPYPNNSTADTILVNNDPNPAGTRVHFDRIELENEVDYIIIKDIDDVPYQWITGSHPGGFTSKAVPGSGIKVQLVSDGSGNTWGYNVDTVETTTPDTPDTEPTFPVTLAESDHPYADQTDQVWTITNPDVNAVSSKVHFSRIELGGGDTIQVLDQNDTVIQTFVAGTNLTNVWSDYVPGRVAKIRLIETSSWTGWGFRVDEIVNSVSNPGLAQSDHPYANQTDQIWTVVNPNVNAVSSKVHFSQIELGGGDTIQVLDQNDTVVQTFVAGTDTTDVWSDYVPGRVVKIRLIETSSWTGWGFRVDEIVNSVSNPGLAQSDHPYANQTDQIWTVVNPNVNAVSSKVHFSQIELGGGDTIQVLDQNDTVIQTFVAGTNLTNVWSDYVPGRVVKIRLIETGSWTGWGFRVDEIQPASDTYPPPAGINAIVIQINEPGDVYLNGVFQFHVSQAGEYKVPLAAGVTFNRAAQDLRTSAADPGLYTITLEYVTHSQTIEVTVGAEGGINIVYLPLVEK